MMTPKCRTIDLIQTRSMVARTRGQGLTSRDVAAGSVLGPTVAGRGTSAVLPLLVTHASCWLCPTRPVAVAHAGVDCNWDRAPSLHMALSHSDTHSLADSSTISLPPALSWMHSCMHALPHRRTALLMHISIPANGMKSAQVKAYMQAYNDTSICMNASYSPSHAYMCAFTESCLHSICRCSYLADTAAADNLKPDKHFQ